MIDTSEPRPDVDEGDQTSLTWRDWRNTLSLAAIVAVLASFVYALCCAQDQETLAGLLVSLSLSAVFCLSIALRLEDRMRHRRLTRRRETT